MDVNAFTHQVVYLVLLSCPTSPLTQFQVSYLDGSCAQGIQWDVSSGCLAHNHRYDRNSVSNLKPDMAVTLAHDSELGLESR